MDKQQGAGHSRGEALLGWLLERLFPGWDGGRAMRVARPRTAASRAVTQPLPVLTPESTGEPLRPLRWWIAPTALLLITVFMPGLGRVWRGPRAVLWLGAPAHHEWVLGKGVATESPRALAERLDEAWVWAAYAEVDADQDEAWEAYERALALDPDDRLTLRRRAAVMIGWTSPPNSGFGTFPFMRDTLRTRSQAYFNPMVARQRVQTALEALAAAEPDNGYVACLKLCATSWTGLSLSARQRLLEMLDAPRFEPGRGAAAERVARWLALRRGLLEGEVLEAMPGAFVPAPETNHLVAALAPAAQGLAYGSLGSGDRGQAGQLLRQLSQRLADAGECGPDLLAATEAAVVAEAVEKGDLFGYYTHQRAADLLASDAGERDGALGQWVRAFVGAGAAPLWPESRAQRTAVASAAAVAGGTALARLVAHQALALMLLAVLASLFAFCGRGRVWHGDEMKPLLAQVALPGLLAAAVVGAWLAHRAVILGPEGRVGVGIPQSVLPYFYLPWTEPVYLLFTLLPTLLLLRWLVLGRLPFRAAAAPTSVTAAVLLTLALAAAMPPAAIRAWQVGEPGRRMVSATDELREAMDDAIPSRR